MPKAKNKSMRSTNRDESDEEMQNVTLTQAERQMQSMAPDEMERKINECVQYILIADQKKLPIKRQEITKHVLKEHSKIFPKIIGKVEEKLQKVFGFELKEVEGKVPRYILINTLEEDGELDKSHISWIFGLDVIDRSREDGRSDEEKAKMGLLTLILTTIFMQGHVIRDNVLFQMLKKLGVDIDRPHEVFGDVKKLITQEFTRQLYLDYERIPKSDPPAYNFQWGPRAEAEIKRGSCLNVICDIYGTKPESWVSQWDYVQKYEGVSRETADEENNENEEPTAGTSRVAARRR